MTCTFHAKSNTRMSRSFPYPRTDWLRALFPVGWDRHGHGPPTVSLAMDSPIVRSNSSAASAISLLRAEIPRNSQSPARPNNSLPIEERAGAAVEEPVDELVGEVGFLAGDGARRPKPAAQFGPIRSCPGSVGPRAGGKRYASQMNDTGGPARPARRVRLMRRLIPRQVLRNSAPRYFSMCLLKNPAISVNAALVSGAVSSRP